jgi:serine/threonine protein kinase
MNFEEDCNIGNFINRGAYGSVYYCTDGEYAIKVVDQVSSNPFKDVSYSEIDSTCRIRSPYLIKCSYIFGKGECNKKLRIAYKLDLCGPTIANILVQKRGSLKVTDYKDFKSLFLTSCFGVRHLHRNNCFHLDLSVGNILVSYPQGEKKTAKIIDPGLSMYTERDSNYNLIPISTRELKVTATSRPPEVYTQQFSRSLIYTYTDKVDVWSLGILFLFYFAGINITEFFFMRGETDQDFLAIIKKMFFDKEVAIIAIREIMSHSRISDNDNERDSFVHLIKGMLMYNPDERLNIEEVVDHEYFSSLKEFFPASNIECNNNIVSPMNSDIPFSDAKMKGVKVLFFTAQSMGNKISMSTFCLSLDIYMRLSISIYDDIEYHQCIIIALLSLRFAYGIYYSLNDDIISKAITGSQDLYKRSGGRGKIEDNMIKYEGKCLKFMRGIIHYHYYYNLCETMEEVVHVIKSVFYSRNMELMGNYMCIDFNKLISKIREDYPKLGNSSKIDTFNKYTIARSNIDEGSKLNNAKIESLRRMVSIICTVHNKYNIEVICVMYDLFFSYISSITEYNTDVLKFLPEACFYLIYSITVDGTKSDIPDNYMKDKKFTDTMSALEESNYFEVALQSRYISIFGSDENIVKFFAYIVFCNGDVDVIVATYNDWNLEAIAEYLINEPDLEYDTNYLIGAQPKHR